MSMLRELVEYLFTEGKKSAEYKLLEHPTDRDQRVVIGPNGVQTMEMARRAPTEVIEVVTHDDFGVCVESRSALAPEVWYDDSKAEVYSDDPHRDLTIRVRFQHQALKEAA